MNLFRHKFCSDMRERYVPREVEIAHDFHELLNDNQVLIFALTL